MDFAASFLAVTLSASFIGAPAPEDTAPAETTEDTPRDDTPREDTELERAMESYKLGTQAYNAARYEDALGHFKEAATRYASPDFQYNIGLCYERLDNPEEAIRAYRTYLRAKPDADDRANVEDRIFRLEQALEAEAKGEPVPEPPPEPDPPPPAGKPYRPLLITGIVLSSVGGAVALGGGIGFGLAARSKSLEVDDVTTGGNPEGLTLPEVEALEDDGRRFETIQIVTAASGAAIAITGIALVAVALKRKKQAQTGARAALVPTLSMRSAGLSLTGRF